MKRHFYLVLTILIASIVLMGASCDDDSPTNTTNGIVKQISSTQGGTLKADDGTEIIVPAGSILDNDAGTAGNISFSIETKVKNLPMPIPAGFTLIGGVTNFGPTNFVFVEPIRLWLPASSLESLEDVAVIRYSEAESSWKTYPIADLDAVGKRIGVAAFELGYFAVVKMQTGSFKVPVIEYAQKSGGIRYDHPSMSSYYITLTVQSFVPKFAGDAGAVTIGSNASTGSQTTGGPLTRTHMGGIPQGDYEIIVSRVLAGTLFNLPGDREYYSIPVPVSVGPFGMTTSWDWYNWTGWTSLVLPGGGNWTKVAPDMWPAPTKPYGTGEFQATLSWVNNSTTATDIDLHLFGPNDLHIYFGNDRDENETLELDRDWMSAYGNATENIYSLKNMTRGEYGVYVTAYSGDVPKQFDVRIIRRGTTVKTYRGTTTSIYSGTDKASMILIEKFSM